MREKLAAFQNSRAGQFLKKVMDDRAPNLAVLLAWGTLNTLFPLVLGILALAGFVLRDPQRLDELTSTLFAVLPQQAASSLSTMLTGTRESAGAASIVSIVLLLFSGSNFFGNMEMVFDIVYHVQDRNFVMQRLIAVVMLVIVTALLLVSTTAYGLGNLIGSTPIGLPVGPVLGRAVGWAISLVSAVVMFLLLYKILPNKSQGWKQTLPGAIASTVLFFIILQLFPLYMALFGKGFQAYAAFGVFLLLMFWLYLLGLVLVLGAELNAFLEEPGRSTALAEATSRAEKGQVDLQQTSAKVEAVATGSATAGGDEPNAVDGPRPAFGAAPSRDNKRPGATPRANESIRGAQRNVGIGGRLIGLVGLLGTAFLLSRQPPTPTDMHSQE
jgi:membrane protein